MLRAGTETGSLMNHLYSRAEAPKAEALEAYVWKLVEGVQ